MPRQTLHLLGSPRLEHDGKSVPLDTRKALALLAYLSVTGQRHGREALAALFWPDYLDGRAVLRRTLSTLTRALGGVALVADRDSIGLAAGADLWVDVVQFRALLTTVDRHDHAASQACATCAAWLDEAVALYSGEFMAGFHLRDSPEFDDWRYFQAESLRAEVAGALDTLVAIRVSQGALEPAIAHARRRLALDPLYEPAHRQLMRLYLWTGQRAAALRQYQRCERLLRDELGETPHQETVDLFHTIRSGGVVPPPGTTPLETHEVESPGDEAASTSGRNTRSETPGDQLPLVGRGAELAALRACHAGINHDGRFVAIEGEAGVGKSRLVDDFLAEARQRGATTLVLRCFAGQAHLAFGPVTEVLRDVLGRADTTVRLRSLPAHHVVEVSRLLPELTTVLPDLPPPPPLDSPGAQARFYDGLSHVLLHLVIGTPPGIVAIDDVHYADQATVDLLVYLVRRLAGRPVLVLAAWRPEEAPDDQRLRQLLVAAGRSGTGTQLVLGRLSRADVGALAAAAGAFPSSIVSGARLTEATVNRMYLETEGLPFFLVEYLAAVDRHGDNQIDRDQPMLGGVQALLRSRLDGIDPAGYQLLVTAAAIGRSFDIDTLLAVVDKPEEDVIAGLEALQARGLIRESHDDQRLSYDFTHEQMRALVYSETSRVRRQLLHRRIADVLIRHQGGAATDNRAGRIAHHLAHAGQPTAAAEYHRLAGESARALFANADALAHFQAALDLGSPDELDLHEAIGDVHVLLGNYGAALVSYAAASQRADRRRQAGIAHKLGSVHHRRGEYARAEACFSTALDADADLSDADRARVLADWSLSAAQQGVADHAHALAHRALALAESSDDTHALAQTHNVLGVLAADRAEWMEARAHLERSLALATNLENAAARASALNNLALVASASGHAADAIGLAEAALELSAALGDRHREAALHSRLADLLHDAARLEPAMHHLKEAVRIYADIGVEAGAVQPHIWKLTEW